MIKKTIFCLLCSTIFITPSFAGIKEGLDAYEQEKYDKAFEEFSYLAAEGDNVAEYHLGLMYQNGLGVEESKTKAAEYFLSAYKNGNLLAASKLGEMLIVGDGIEQDEENGLALLKSAALSGNKEALYALGEMHLDGKGVEKNFVYAAGFYKMAALQGYAPAQFKLSLLYLTGRGVPQDYPLAIRWLSRSANQGYVQAQKELAIQRSANSRLTDITEAYAWLSVIAAYNSDETGKWAAEKRDEVAKKIKDGKNLSIAQQMARKWRPVEASKTVPKEELMAPSPIIPGFNDDETLRKLSEQQQNIVLSDATTFGISSDEIEDALVAHDTAELEKKIIESGKNGKPAAFTYWGKIVEQRMKNPEKALTWYQQGADYGDAEGAFYVGKAYCEGKLLTSNPVDCYYWLLIAEQRAGEALKPTVSSVLEDVVAQLTQEEIEQGKKKAASFKALSDTPAKKSFKLF